MKVKDRWFKCRICNKKFKRTDTYHLRLFGLFYVSICKKDDKEHWCRRIRNVRRKNK
jgi:hypothetical protein